MAVKMPKSAAIIRKKSAKHGHNTEDVFPRTNMPVSGHAPKEVRARIPKVRGKK